MSRLAETLAGHILRVVHVGFVVEDLDTAVADACRLYGIDAGAVSYQPPAGEPAPTRFAFLSVAGLQFEYIEPCEDGFRQLLLGQPSGGGGINHVAWQVDDIDAALALLARQGIGPGYVTPDGAVTIGHKRMVYLDPADTGGLLVELIQLTQAIPDA